MTTDNQLIIGETVYSIESGILGFYIKQKPSSNIAFYGYDEKYKRLFIQFKIYILRTFRILCTK